MPQRVELEGEQGPKGYLAGAADFVRAAKALKDTGSDHFIACWHLTGQALELALTAYLLQCGLKRDELRNAGHQLAELWKLAGRQSSVFGSPPPEWVELLDRRHQPPYSIRYPWSTFGFKGPPMHRVLQELDWVVERVAHEYQPKPVLNELRSRRAQAVS
jgi:hypothetical protein